MHPNTISVAMTRREIREQQEFERNAPWGSYFANALAFIVESMNEEHTMGEIENMDIDTMLEFADMYNFTPDALQKAIDAFRPAAYKLADEE